MSDQETIAYYIDNADPAIRRVAIITYLNSILALFAPEVVATLKQDIENKLVEAELIPPGE